MRLFLDCEYNDFKGELISIAIVSEDGKEWYEVVPCEFPKEWVNEHVMPILGKSAITYQDMQHSLELWLSQFDSVHVIADWPEDIQHFCNALIIGAGMRINTPPLTMEVLRIDAESTLPHNALHDARGIRDAVCGSPPPQEYHKEPKTKKTTPYPTWVCHECGIRYGRRVPTCATYHDNKCDVCGKFGPVTQPRDYGHIMVEEE